MKMSHTTMRSLLLIAIGCTSWLGCRTGSSSNEVPPFDGPIATDVALRSDATIRPSPEPIQLQLETAAASDNTNKIELVGFQASSPLQDTSLTNLTAPVPIPNVEQTSLTLESIQNIALANNPAIRALSASALAESDYQYQVGRWANPSVGYAGNQLADQQTDQHLAYVEQTFVTAGKLKLNQDVVGHSAEAQRWDVESQRMRVLTDVRMKFIQALVAQRQMEVIDNFHGVIQKGAELAQRRFQAEESPQADLLQAEIQLNEVEVMRQQAEYRWNAAWQEMAAAAGVPNMQPSKLHGDLNAAQESLDWEVVFNELLSQSPELHAAHSRVCQARANLSRQEIQAIPNLTANLQGGVDNATGSGMIQVQVGGAIPVFNNNQGNTSAAFNQYSRATHEVKRIEMSLKARLAQVSQEYNSSQVAVQRYEQAILPRAQKTLDLAETAYQAGEFSFIQTLIARRTYFDTNLNYLTSLGDLAQAQAKVDGLLLTGALDAANTSSLGDSLRGQTFSQQ